MFKFGKKKVFAALKENKKGTKMAYLRFENFIMIKRLNVFEVFDRLFKKWFQPIYLIT